MLVEDTTETLDSFLGQRCSSCGCVREGLGWPVINVDDCPQGLDMIPVSFPFEILNPLFGLSVLVDSCVGRGASCGQCRFLQRGRIEQTPIDKIVLQWFLHKLHRVQCLVIVVFATRDENSGWGRGGCCKSGKATTADLHGWHGYPLYIIPIVFQHEQLHRCRRKIRLGLSSQCARIRPFLRATRLCPERAVSIGGMECVAFHT